MLDRTPAPLAVSGSAIHTGEIRSLTGTRGCAAVMVILYHYSLSVPVAAPGLQGFLQNGYLFVDLFFVLSGFVMAYSQAGLFESRYRVRAHLGFLVARLARIYPLYALISIESFCLLVWRSPDLDVPALGKLLLLNLALVQAWGLAPSLEGAAWSISTEWAAYLLFPLLLAGCLLASRRVAAAMTIGSVVAILFVSLSYDHVSFSGQGRTGPLDVYSSATALPLLRCLAEFSLGLITFRIARATREWVRRYAPALAWGVVIAVLAGLSFSQLDVLVVVLFPLLIIALVPERGAVARFLGLPVPYRLGQWSYSIYLIHDKFSHPASLIQEWLAPRIPWAAEITILATAVLVILIGATTFYVIEIPLRKLVMHAVRSWHTDPQGHARVAGLPG